MARKKIYREWSVDGELLRKECGKCGEVKEAGDFTKDSRRADGKDVRCRDCKATNSRQYYQANRERLNTYSRQYYEANSERYAEYRSTHRERNAEYSRRYRRENREQIAEYRRRHYQENREQIATRNRRHYQENRERYAEYQRRYVQANSERVTERNRQYRRANRERLAQHRHAHRARKLDAECCGLLPEQVERLYASTCVYCGDPAEHIDHIEPLAGEGLHCAANLVPACTSCNTSKGAKPLPEFLAYRASLGLVALCDETLTGVYPCQREQEAAA